MCQTEGRTRDTAAAPWLRGERRWGRGGEEEQGGMAVGGGLPRTHHRAAEKK